MAKGIVDLVDRDFSLVHRDARFGIKPLRTRPGSFAFMSTLWSNWRREYLKRKLEKQKEALLQESFEADATGALSDSSMKKMEKKTEAIAGLEQRLKFLSKETIPRNFVAAHAIKLRRSMFEHLTFNGRNAYSVGLDKYDEVFGNNQENELAADVSIPVPVSVEEGMSSVESSTSVPDNVEETIASVDNGIPVPISSEESADSLNVVPTLIQRDAIQSTLGGSFAEKESEINSNVQKISPHDVEMVTTGKDRFEDSLSSKDLPVSGDESIVDEIESSLGDVTVIPTVGEDIQNSQDTSSKDISLDNNSGLNSSITEGVDIAQDVPEDVTVPEISSEVEPADAVVDEPVTTVETDIASIVSDDSAVNPSKESSIDAALENISTMPSPSVGEDESVDSESKLQDDIASIATSDDTSLDGVRVSQNGSTVAKIDHFTDEGEATYREWIPLSEEEIAAAQRDLAEHPVRGTISEESFEVREEEPKTSDEAVRDEVVVAPDRAVQTFTDLFDNQQVDDSSLDDDSQVEVAEEEQDQSILPTEDSVEQIASSLQHATTLEEFRSLKDAVVELQRKQKETNQERKQAESRAHEKQALLSERMARLNEYREALLEDCTFNENKTRSANSSVETSEKIIEEIDSLIGSQEAVHVTVKGR